LGARVDRLEVLEFLDRRKRVNLSGPIRYISDPLLFVVLVASFLFGMVLHNVVQSRLAAYFGDSSALASGTTSTDPQVHFDLFSLLWYVLIGFCTPRTIIVRGSRMKGRGMDELKVWLSGPLTLLVWAFVLSFVARVVLMLGQGGVTSSLYSGLTAAATASLLHAVVFIFPLPGLDGGHALYAVGNFQTRQILDRVANAGPLVLFIFFIALSFSGVFGYLMSPLMKGIEVLLNLLPFLPKDPSVILGL
jgi:hypothetical protein